MSSQVNQHFDKVYVLSLKSAEAQRIRMTELLGKLNIDFEFSDAVDGNSMRFDSEWEAYTNRLLVTPYERKKCRKLISSRGAWGCLKSYISLMKQVLAGGYERVLIFEDDIYFSKKFEQDFNSFMSSVASDWKLLMLGASQGNWVDQTFSEWFYHPTAHRTYGAFAVGYHISAIPQILYEAVQMEFPFDKTPIGSVFTSHPDQCFVAFPNMVIADVRESSIREDRDLSAHATKMKWKLDLIDIPL